ncbi:MAG: hypothetical protein JST51_01535 [Armatimonadetes bacterium]|nr:hypothetical protein [Armatimonadota bacterium]
MKRIITFAVGLLLAMSAFAISPPKTIDFKLSNAWTPPTANLTIEPVSFQGTAPMPPPTTYAIEAIYDRDTESAAVGVSAFWKQFTDVGPKKQAVDVFWFGGLDKGGVPLGAFTGKIPITIADQLQIYISPAYEIKQGRKGGLTLFAGFTLK